MSRLIRLYSSSDSWWSISLLSSPCLIICARLLVEQRADPDELTERERAVAEVEHVVRSGVRRDPVDARWTVRFLPIPADVLFLPMLQFTVRNQLMERTQFFLVTWSYNPVEHAVQTA